MWDDWYNVEAAQRRLDHPETVEEAVADTAAAAAEEADRIVRAAADHPAGQDTPSMREAGVYRTVAGRLVREDFPEQPKPEPLTDAEGLRLYIRDLRNLAERLRGKP